MNKIKIGIVEGDPKARKIIHRMMENHPEIEVVLVATNGRLLQFELEEKKIIPEILLIDTDMPVMNGVETTVWMREHYPAVKLVAFAKDPSDREIIKMLTSGCCSFMYFLSEDLEFRQALKKVLKNGYFNPEAAEHFLAPFIEYKTEVKSVLITKTEEQFLQFAFGAMSYDEILIEMGIDDKTGQRIIGTLFKKFRARSRTGLVLEALRNGFSVQQ